MRSSRQRGGWPRNHEGSVWQVAPPCDRRRLSSRHCIDFPFDLRSSSPALPLVGAGEDHLDRTDRPGRSIITSRRGIHGRGSPASLSRAFAKHNPSTTSLISHPPAPAMARQKATVWMRGSPAADPGLDPALHPDAHFDLFDAAEPPRTALVTASLRANTSRHPAGDGDRRLMQACRAALRSPAGQLAMRQGDTSYRPLPALWPSWPGGGQARVVQLRHRTNVAAAWRQPSHSPRQSPPAATLTAVPF
jgi:hypothetical protein